MVSLVASMCMSTHTFSWVTIIQLASNQCFSAFQGWFYWVLWFFLFIFIFIFVRWSEAIISLNLFKIGQGSKLTLKISFPQISYYDSTKIINFVEIETVDTNSIFYCFHSFGSRLLSLFCAQKGRIYLTHKFDLHFHSNYMLF